MRTIQLNSGALIRIDGGVLISEGLKEEVSFSPEDLREGRVDSHDAADYNTAIDGMESLLLALHCAGVEIDTPQFKGAIEVAVESIVNNLG